MNITEHQQLLKLIRTVDELEQRVTELEARPHANETITTPHIDKRSKAYRESVGR